MIEVALEYIKTFVKTPYLYGGDSPAGIDCSGLILQYLKCLGLVPESKDMTAAMIYSEFKKFEVQYPQTGDLIFYRDKKKNIVHCEIIIAPGFSIGSNGGDSSCVNSEIAYRLGAFVKIRTYKNKKPSCYVSINDIIGEHNG